MSEIQTSKFFPFGKVTEMYKRTPTGIEWFGIGDVTEIDEKNFSFEKFNPVRFCLPFCEIFCSAYTLEEKRLLTKALEDGFKEKKQAVPQFNNLARKYQCNIKTAFGFGQYYYSEMGVLKLTVFILEIYVKILERDCLLEIKANRGNRRGFLKEGKNYEAKFSFLTPKNIKRLNEFLSGKLKVGSLQVFKLVGDWQGLNPCKALSIFGEMLLACYFEEDPELKTKTGEVGRSLKNIFSQYRAETEQKLAELLRR